MQRSVSANGHSEIPKEYMDEFSRRKLCVDGIANGIFAFYFI
jgi:hypothetical protein